MHLVIAVVALAGQAVGLAIAADSSGASTTVGSGAWERVVLGDGCQCSDGSEFNIWIREANPEQVIFYLEDGGACFNAETCAPDSGLYHTAVTETPSGEGGVFDFADARNPFADYSVVYVPYCTGDVHLGDTTTEYAPGVTVHHSGLVNGTAALERLASSFPDATEVVVMGESAGSVAAPLYGGLVSDRFPDARVTVLADGSGSYPDDPTFNRVFQLWGAVDATAAWPESAEAGGDLWTAPGMYIQSGRHDPAIVFGRLDYAYDQRQAPWYELLGVPADDLLDRMVANETQIEHAGVDVASYTAAGEDHTMLTEDEFYTIEVDGQPLRDWVARLVAGEPVTDVRCTECEGG